MCVCVYARASFLCVPDAWPRGIRQILLFLAPVQLPRRRWIEQEAWPFSTEATTSRQSRAELIKITSTGFGGPVKVKGA